MHPLNILNKKSSIVPHIKLKMILILLLPLAILLNKLYLFYPETWEKFYSLGINKYLIQLSSISLNIFPFSVVEILLYICIFTLIIFTLFTFYKILCAIPKWKQSFIILFNYLLTMFSLTCLIIFIFVTFWGLNYNRPPFSTQYGLEVGNYSPEDLGKLYSHLLDEASSIRSKLPETPNGLMTPYGDYKDIFDRAEKGFEVISKEFPSLKGFYGKAKPLLSSKILSYTGITGIYSPFTGEPNININVPLLTLPSTTCHEMAHQRGYAFENECNFISFIACMSNPDLDFQYSGLILAISYTSNALARIDITKLKELNTDMNPKVFGDLESINLFWDKYQGEIQEVATAINDTYLKSNGVASGTANYGEVVNLLLALYDKYY
ncbi:MAG: DUF3810 domain-containing protein [Cellulosilyticaceae bacterium]